MNPIELCEQAPVVYVHGAFSSPSAWRGILKVVDGRRRTIVPTMPGLVEPPTPALLADHCLEREVDLLAGYITAETEEPVQLVGHSYGALLALAAALSDRIAIRGCTLFEPLMLDLLKHTGDAAPLGELTDFLDGYRAAHEQGDPWAVRPMIDLWGGAGFFDSLPEKIQSTMAGMTAFNLLQWSSNLAYAPSLDRFRGLSIPITLVHGEVTYPLCKRVNERLHGLLANSRLVEIEGASHFLIQSHAEACAAIIEEDLAVGI
ncbi:MAG: alpha/beta hydrolase [Proteobacteria bacterium]|nr:alpha/beta hydrolase [Pseudomonadota bacterium]